MRSNLRKIHPTSQAFRSATRPVVRGRHPLRACFRLLCAALLVLLSASVSLSIPFNDYRDHVNKAISALDRLIQSKEGQTESQRADSISEIIRSTRQALPRTEMVQWQGTSFVADNSWLDDDLKEFEAMPALDANRARLLDRIRERLQALQERLEETSKAEQTQGLRKDEMKGRLTAILQRSEYAGEVDKPSALERFLRWFLEWLNKLFPRTSQLSPGGARMVTRIAQIFVAGLAAAVIAYVIWLTVPYLLHQRRTKRKTKAEARVVLGERLEPDQSGADLLAEAEALARAGDLRGAIRKGYIALLVELGDRKVISLAQYKTNRDYLRSVREIENLYGNMEKLTSSFEQHWYGLAQASETDWTTFRAFYRAALALS